MPGDNSTLKGTKPPETGKVLIDQKTTASSNTTLPPESNPLVRIINDINDQLTRIHQLSTSVDLSQPQTVLAFLGAAQIMPKLCEKLDLTWDKHLNDPNSTLTSATITPSRNLIFQILAQVQATSAHASRTVSSTSSNSSAPALAVPQLPKIALPSFNGDFRQWQTFHDSFYSLIHSQPAISRIDKLHYLIGCLSGDAAQIISSIPRTEDGYLQAWTALTSFFGNPRRQANSHLQALMAVHPSADPLRRVMFDDIEHITALKRSGAPDLADYLLCTLAISHLDAETRQAFENHVQATPFPTVQQLQNFVQARYQARTMSSSSSGATKPVLSTPVASSSSTRPQQRPNHSSRPQQRPFHSSVAISAAESSSPTRISGPCTFCDMAHSIRQCAAFKQLPVADRRDFVVTYALCRNCMSCHHATSECKSSHRCHICSKIHHTILHLEPDSSATNLPSSEPQSDARAASPPLSQRTQQSSCFANLHRRSAKSPSPSPAHDAEKSSPIKDSWSSASSASSTASDSSRKQRRRPRRSSLAADVWSN